MKTLDASELLQAWERGAGFPPARAILPLLALACPELSADLFPSLTIGERDGLLLTQREWLFGPRLEAASACQKCGERLEFSLAIEELRATPAITDASSLGQMQPVTATVGKYQLRARAPTIADLQNTTTLEQLLDRCLLEATCNGEKQTASELPAEIAEAIAHELAQADPQADLQLVLRCPTCEHEWLAVFDIAAFLWEEIDAWAYRTLLQIHQLASAYGWNEAEILALSPARRQIYLTMIGAF